MSEQKKFTLETNKRQEPDSSTGASTLTANTPTSSAARRPSPDNIEVSEDNIFHWENIPPIQSTGVEMYKNPKVRRTSAPILPNTGLTSLGRHSLKPELYTLKSYERGGMNMYLEN